jgi:hypothetical protein
VVFAVVMLDRGAPTGVLLDAYTTPGAADMWASDRLAEYRVVPAEDRAGAAGGGSAVVFAVVELDRGNPTGVVLDGYGTAAVAELAARTLFDDYRVVPAVHLTGSARARAGSLAGRPRVPMLAPSTVSGAR